MDASVGAELLRFGVFELDPQDRTLRKNGRKVSIEGKPFDLLLLLLEHPGRLVGRDEIKARLWGESAFLDFDSGIGTAVSKIRSALGDSAESPRFLETVKGKGLRFLADVHRLPTTPREARHSPTLPSEMPRRVASAAAPAVTPLIARGSERVSFRHGTATAIVLTALFSAIGSAYLMSQRAVTDFNEHDRILLADFKDETGDSRLAPALLAAFTVSVEQSRRAEVYPRVRLDSVLRRMGKPPDTAITSVIGREICLREGIRALVDGTVTRVGTRYALQVELTDPQNSHVVRSYSERASGEDQILAALDKIARHLREDLGESLLQIHGTDRALPQVTTSSIGALKEYTDGETLWHKGKYHDAVVQFNAAIASDADFAMAHAALGNAYFSYIFNEQQRGIQEYQRALALQERLTEREALQINLSYALSLDHAATIESSFNAYLRTYPEDWQVRNQFAYFLRTHRRQEEAVDQYKRLLALAPGDAPTYIELATAYSGLGRHQDAVDTYQRAFSLQPDLDVLQIDREFGFQLVEAGHEAQAVQIFAQQLGRPDTRESALRSLATLDLLHGRARSAQRRLTEALLIDRAAPALLSTARVHLWLSFVAKLQGNKIGERMELDAAAQNFDALGPKVVFGSWLALSYLDAGAPAKAQTLLSRITPLVDSESKEQTGYLHLVQGSLAAKQGELSKALDTLSLAVHEHENNSSTTYSVEILADAYQQAGQPSEALPFYERLLGTDERNFPLWEPLPGWLEAHYTLAQDYKIAGDRRKAQHALSSLLALWAGADAELPLLLKAKSLQKSME